MGVENVSNKRVTPDTGIAIQGQNGQKLSKEENKLAQVIANLDGKGKLSKTDVEKLKAMKPEEQIKFLNDALKDTGYKVAKVYDAETEEITEGITWQKYKDQKGEVTKNGVFINFSKDGKTIGTDIMGNTSGKNGHLGIRW